MNNFDQQELDKFSKLADEWWDPNGKFKPLHLINPLRISYIEEKISIKDLDILDIGCGGGILCEPLARLGAKVVGIDENEKAVLVAKKHAKKMNLKASECIVFEDAESGVIAAKKGGFNVVSVGNTISSVAISTESFFSQLISSAIML